MPLTPPECRCTRQAIAALLSDHVKAPFEILRERGVVAELRDRLKSCPGLGDLAVARLRPQAALHRHPAPRAAARLVRVRRLQLEMTATTRSPSAIAKALDIVILAPEPDVYHARGHGDVIQQTRPECLAAAIEIKASPSSDKTAGGEYAKDLFALLWLAGAYGVSSYFIVLDKAQDFYRQPDADPAATTEMPAWMAPAEGALVWRTRAHARSGRDAASERTSLDLLGIELSSSEPAPPFVEVWTVERQATGQPAARCRYATLRPGAVNRHLQAAASRAGP